MKKRGRIIQIHLSDKFFYTLVAIGILIVVAIGVYAYGTSDPSTFGHSAAELEEADPTVLASVKDGVAWSELSGIPAGFADGVDNEGAGTGTETDPTVMSWAKTNNPDIPLGSLVLYDEYHHTSHSCNTWCSPNRCLAALTYNPDNEIACSGASLVGPRYLSCLCVKRWND